MKKVQENKIVKIFPWSMLTLKERHNTWRKFFQPRFVVVPKTGRFFDKEDSVVLKAAESYCPDELLYAVEAALNNEKYDALEDTAEIEKHVSRDECYITIKYMDDTYTFYVYCGSYILPQVDYDIDIADQIENYFVDYIVKSFKQNVKGAK